MVLMTGTYEHTIDSKQRLAIPAELRNQIARAQGTASDQPISLYVTPGDDGALYLYTPEAFEKRSQELDNAEANDELFAYELLYYAESRLVETDKQGRVRIPDQLMKMVAFSSEVVLLGAKDHLEIRDRQAWQEMRARMLEQRQGMRMNPRRAVQAGH